MNLNRANEQIEAIKLAKMILLMMPIFLPKDGKNLEKTTPAPICTIVEIDINASLLTLASRRKGIRTNIIP